MTSPVRVVARRAAHTGGSLVRQVRSAVAPSAGRPANVGQPASGWLVVTVFREPADLETADLPGPLSELGDRIEVRVSPAADSKGTELAARLRDRAGSGATLDRLAGTDAQSDLRSALRRAKQLLEVGEVLVVDPTPHGDRKPTPGGVLLEAWTKLAAKGGVR
jgi:hypothetical protein